MNRPEFTKQRSAQGPSHVVHASFFKPNAEQKYGPDGVGARDYGDTYMPDEVTRDFAQRMHYAAHRADRAGRPATRRRWHEAYLQFRDRIVLGNRKLIYRAVGRWKPPPSLADDMAGDCQIVLIQAVAAFNPWIGIRFSTYAFTCLMRALSRLSQRHASDRLAKSLSLEALPDGEPAELDSEETPSVRLARVDQFLRVDNDLLSTREKRVLIRRFSLDEQAKGGTLEQVGLEMGLSKERVRQVQASALAKLRGILME
jgi:RNA polymerase sigma factor (sigma-70 family)